MENQNPVPVQPVQPVQQVTSTSPQTNFGFMDLLMYFGGFSLFLGIYYFVINFWNTMGSFLQILSTLVVAIILIITGVYLNKNLKLYKLGSPLLFLSYFLFPLGVYVLNTKLGIDFELNENYIVTFLVTSIVFAFIYKILDSYLSLFFALTYYALFYGGFVYRISYNYVQSFYEFYSSNIISSSFIFFGLSGYYLAKYFYDKNKLFYYFINFISVNSLLFGLWFFYYFFKPGEFVLNLWMVVFPITILGIIYYARKVNDILLKIFSFIYLFFYIVYLIYKNISSQYFVPVLLVSLGFILIVSGFYFYLRKSKTTENQVTSINPNQETK